MMESTVDGDHGVAVREVAAFVAVLVDACEQLAQRARPTGRAA